VGASTRLRVTVASVTFAFCMAIAFGVIGASARADQAQAASTSLSVLGGDVRIRHASGDVTVAADGDLLAAADSVETGADGRAVITFFEGSTVEIEPSSAISIDALSVEADGGTIVRLTQAAGRTWHVVTKLLTGSSRYEVRTPASTASVRGTQFEIDVTVVDGDPVATVLTSEGRVAHSAPDPARPGETTEVIVTPGTQASARPGRPVEQPRPKAVDQRTVTVRVESPTSLVVDPLGRANGVRADGKVVVQTPGARVERSGGAMTVTLPNIPDGKIGTHVDGDGVAKDVDVTTTVADEDADPVVLRDHVRTTRGGQQKTGVDVKSGASKKPEVRPITTPERSALPTPKVKPTTRPHAAERRGVGLPSLPTTRPLTEGTSTPRPTRR
jgi:hypothetical protein